MYTDIKNDPFEKCKIYLPTLSINVKKIYGLRRVYLPEIAFICQNVKIISRLMRDEYGFFGWAVQCPVKIDIELNAEMLNMMVLKDSDFMDFALVPDISDRERAVIIHDGIRNRITSNDISNKFSVSG